MQDGHLVGKFMVERLDGSRRADSRFFVLDYATDPYARAALSAYADTCESTHPVLAEDLRQVCEYYEGASASGQDAEGKVAARSALDVG